MHHNVLFSPRRSAFTLIELLVVIAIIAILSIVVVLTLNPAQLLMQSRDSNRLSDLATMNSALGIYSAEGGTSLGSSNVVYVSIPDLTATSTAGDQCQGLGLPTAPSGTTYFCAASSTSRATNGTGWIPVNFSTLAAGSPLGSLPQDLMNQSSTGLYYTYTTNGSQYIVTALPEAQKTKTQFGITPVIPDYPDVMANGSNLTISPLFSATGLVGYWNLDEGTGTTAYDTSGNGNVGTWSGSTPYYAGGKVGPYAGNFNASNNLVSIANAPVPHGASAWPNFTLSAWIYATAANYNIIFADILTSGGSNQTTGNFFMRLNPSGILQGSVFTGNNTTPVTYDSAGTVPLNQWVYVSMVSTNTANPITLYINGVGSSVTSSQSFAPSGLNLTDIGYDGVSPQYWSGSIDDVRLYGRALSASEVAAVYNAQR